MLQTRLFSIAIVSLTLAGSPVAAQEARAVPVAPIYDAGAVDKGKTIRHSFEIRNVGTETLRIRDVSSSCGCAVAEFDRSIGPGKSGRVVTTIETRDFRGPIAKAVTVFTDDTANPRIKLVVKADIRPMFELQPVYARFVVVVGEEHPISEHLLWASDATPMEVTAVESPYRFLEASYREASAKERRSEGPDKQWKIVLTLAADAPVGPMADFVRIRTNRPGSKLIKLPVSGFVQPVIAVRPRMVDFGRRELDGPYSAFLEVENLSSVTVDVTSADTDITGVMADIEPIDDSKKFRVRLTLDPEMEKGPFTGKLRLETSSRLQPLVEVDVTGTIL